MSRHWSRSQPSNRKRRLQIESLERRLNMAALNVVGTVDLLALIDIQKAGTPNINGTAEIAASLTFLNSGDFTQQSVVDPVAISSGTITGVLDIAATINGTFETDDVPPTITFTFVAAPLLDIDVLQTGTFQAQVNGQPVSGTFVATIDATADFSTQTVSGTIQIELMGTGNFEDTEIIPFVNQPLTITPSDYDLPVAALGSISDRVWFDDNGNGILDSTEFGAAGIDIALIDTVNGVIGDDDDALVGQTLSNTAGFYAFINVEPGNYYLELSGLLTGQQFTVANAGADDTLDSDVDPATGRTGILTVGVATHTRTVDAGIQDTIARWQKPGDRFNVSGTGGVDPFDMALVLRELKLHGNRRLDPMRDPAPPPFYDVSGDNRITPQDPLQVLTFLKTNGNSEGEANRVATERAFADLNSWLLAIDYSEYGPINPRGKRR